MITPTVGRIVWFRPRVGSLEYAIDPKQPFATIITFVWHDRLINVVFFDHTGCKYSAQSIPLLQDDDLKPEHGYFATWMPYQVKVAKGEIPPTLHAQ